MVAENLHKPSFRELCIQIIKVSKKPLEVPLTAEAWRYPSVTGEILGGILGCGSPLVSLVCMAGCLGGNRAGLCAAGDSLIWGMVRAGVRARVASLHTEMGLKHADPLCCSSHEGEGEHLKAIKSCQLTCGTSCPTGWVK